MRLVQRTNRMVFLCLIVSISMKVVLLRMDALPFNSDEAIVGLMARHILAGSRPSFFYGQAYMGSLDAFFVAAGFRLFGSEVWVIRSIQIILYLGTIITTVIMGKVILGSTKTGLLAACLLAVPTVNMTLYTTVSLGGYGEALLAGNLILLIGYYIAEDIDAHEMVFNQPLLMRKFKWIFVWGVAAGLGFWSNGITLVYSLPVGVLIIYYIMRLGRRNRYRWAVSLVLICGLGFILGSLPWWINVIQQGWQMLFAELLGSAVAVEGGTYVENVATHLFSLVVLGGSAVIGIRPPWEVRWLVFPLIPFDLAFWIGVGLFSVRRIWTRRTLLKSYGLLIGVIGLVCVGFVFTSFGADPSGRYFLPVMVPLSLFAGEMVRSIYKKVRWQYGIIGFIMIYNLLGTIQCGSNYPGLTTQFDSQTIIDHRFDSDLIEFLTAQGELRGYTNYWVSYPLAFLSDEELIFVPQLPYHQDLRYTMRDDRYAPYRDIVSKSDQTAFITSRTPLVDDQIRDSFRSLEIEWAEEKIGDYVIFYQLSRKVVPMELGF